MAALPAILLCVLLIADESAWTLSRLDLALGAILLVALGARAVDGLVLGGTTADGRPTTRSHVLGYTLRVVAMTGIGWIAAQAVSV